MILLSLRFVACIVCLTRRDKSWQSKRKLHRSWPQNRTQTKGEIRPDVHRPPKGGSKRGDPEKGDPEKRSPLGDSTVTRKRLLSDLLVGSPFSDPPLPCDVKTWLE